MKKVMMLFIAGIMIACNNEKNNSPATETISDTAKKESVPAGHLVFEKLVGTWKSEDGKSFEEWSKNEKGYQSRAYSVKGADTSWNEQASIYPENNQWVFENTVKGQNDGKAIKFTSSILTGHQVQFSNPAHDFPTDINYTVADVNTIHAFIVGPNSKGGKDTIPFNYTRVK